MSPDPFVPADVDLRDFPYTPIFRSRLFGSSFHARTTDSEWRAGVTLWLKSWDQVPAGSLPDDEIDLCRLAELGRDLKQWRKVADAALRGWIKCSDGRLYHPTVAEGVLEATTKRKSASAKGKAGAAKRWAELNAAKDAQALEIDGTSNSTGNASVNGASNAPAVAQAMPGDGKGREGKGIEEKALPQSSSVLDSPLPTTTSENPDPIHRRACEIAGLLRRRGAGVTASDPRVRTWAGNPAATDAALLGALEAAQEARAKANDSTAINAGYIDKILGNQIAKVPTYDLEALAKL